MRAPTTVPLSGCQLDAARRPAAYLLGEACWAESAGTAGTAMITRPKSLYHPEPSTARRRRRSGAVVLLCCSGACTPLRELSSYSDDPTSIGGASPDTSAAGAGASSPLSAPDDGLGGRPPPLDAGAVVAPSPVPELDVGADAGAPNAPPPVCDALQEIAGDDGRCYFIGAQLSDWLASSVACEGWGGALARIDSPEEQALLSQSIGADTWIGLNDRESEGDLRWADGSALGDYAPWAAEQPDDFDGGEDCVELLTDDRGWNDRPCSDLRPFLCER